LDANRVPDFHRTNGTGNITDKDTFKLWYFGTNSSGAVKDKFGTTAVVVDSIQSSLRLTQQSGQPGVYRFSSGTHYPLGNTAAGVAEQGSGFSCAQNTGDSCCNSGGTCVGRNYHFTTQLRYFFQYKGGETLTFAGDDDVWVFINGRHAVDIGGIHGPQYGRVILGDDGDGNGTDSNCSVHNGGSLPSCSLQSGESTAANLADDKRFGLVKDGVYEIVLFHAERRTSGSNFDLTLAGFLAPRSTCSTTCGDGIVAGNELCDQGSSNRNGVYGVCNTSCGFTFCGDNTTTAPETCDNGRNIDTYVAGSLSGKCAPGCMTPGRCGDGIRQSSSEVCDDGVNDGSYGGCAAGCQALAGYCGDGVQNGAEDCDAGVNTTSYRADGTGCGFDCKPAPYCGDQERNGPEQCDPSVPGQQNCNSNCEFAPFCGDGVRGGNEECDYGILASTVRRVKLPMAPVRPRARLAPPAVTAFGNWQRSAMMGNDPLTGNVDGAYNRCTTSCTFGPRCGDGVVSSSQSEACDNGYNEDTYAYVSDACGPSCQAVPYCGDAVLQSDFELCDNGSTGPNRNASDAYNGCTPSCDWGPYCGDGIKNGPETCDQGGANTAYQSAKGACGYDCDWASYCGDGVKTGLSSAISAPTTRALTAGAKQIAPLPPAAATAK
jgi:fibro-slime domain-containing protein